MLTASQRGELLTVPRSEHSVRRHGELVRATGGARGEFRDGIEWTLCASGSAQQYHGLNTLHNIAAATFMTTSGHPNAREEENEALTRRAAGARRAHARGRASSSER